MIELVRNLGLVAYNKLKVEIDPISGLAEVGAASPCGPLMASPKLLAHISVSKYNVHLPLYRRGEIITRMGAENQSSILIDLCGQAVGVLEKEQS